MPFQRGGTGGIYMVHQESTISLEGAVHAKETQVQTMTKMALCVALCCVSGFISFPLPFTPGLVTALTMALGVTAFVLTPKQTFITICVYVMMGGIGLPIFPGGRGGLGALLGPTGGFYLAFPIAYLLVSYFKGKAINLKRYAIVNIILGVPLSYVGGLISMMLVMNVGLWEGLVMAVFPFIPGDIMKAVGAAFIAVKVNKVLANR